MKTQDFITEQQIEELPGDDPPRAFVEFVRIVETRLEAMLDAYRGDNNDREGEEDARYGFQSIVIAAGRNYSIEPYASMDLPALGDYQYENFRQFRADLKHYIMQLRLGLAGQDRNDSVPLSEKSGDTIRARIYYLREAIEKDTDLTEAKRAHLLKRLDDLVAELSRRRVRLLAVARVVYEILALPGMLNETRVAVDQFATYVMREIGEARTVENENREIPHEEPLALLPPRKPQVEPEGFTRQELEDEIPF